MKFNVVYNNQISGWEKALKKLKSVLEIKNAEFKLFDIDNLQNYGDFTFVIGGDGTLLKTARFYSASPVLGINLGRLGFLSQAGIDEIEQVVDKAPVLLHGLHVLVENGVFLVGHFVAAGLFQTGELFIKFQCHNVFLL